MNNSLFLTISTVFSNTINQLTPMATIVLPAAVLILLLLCLIILKLIALSPAQNTHFLNQDFHAIAGADVFSTQLDLARAYMEIGEKQLAKKILKKIRPKKNSAEQQQINQLLANL